MPRPRGGRGHPPEVGPAPRPRPQLRGLLSQLPESRRPPPQALQEDSAQPRGPRDDLGDQEDEQECGEQLDPGVRRLPPPESWSLPGLRDAEPSVQLHQGHEERGERGCEEWRDGGQQGDGGHQGGGLHRKAGGRRLPGQGGEDGGWGQHTHHQSGLGLRHSVGQLEANNEVI